MTLGQIEACSTPVEGSSIRGNRGEPASLYTNEENLIEPAQEIDNRVPHKINNKHKQFINGEEPNDTPKSLDN